MLLVLALGWAHSANAELKLIPYGISQIQFDSNVYRVSSTAAAPVIDGKRVRSDQIILNTLGLDTQYEYSEQKFRAQVEGRQFNYLNTTGLNHNEYLISAGLDWVLIRRLTGSFDFRQERRLASFADRDTSRLILERDRVGGGKVDFTFANDWRLEGGYKVHELFSPLPQFPEFTLNENTSTVALQYLGISKITAGVSGDYLTGDYTGSSAAAAFKQYSIQSTLGYEATGLSAFNLALGFTSRQGDTQVGKTAELTGSIGYRRQITGKTSARSSIFRRVVSYTAGNNSVIETGGNIGVEWEATAKITVGTTYEYTDGAFQASNLPGGIANDNRKDRYQAVSLNLSYEPLRWLQVRSYATYQARISNIEINSYNTSLIGLELRARFE